MILNSAYPVHNPSMFKNIEHDSCKPLTAMRTPDAPKSK
jgi:hypothetical protein